jgi:tetratricopeptide (TPR) repeat protein
MDTNFIEKRCDEAYELAKADKYEEALAICDEVATVKGGEIPSYRERCAILSRWKRYEEAFTAINTAIMLGSDEPADYYKMGSISFRLGNYQDSITALTTSIDISEREHDTYYRTASLFIRAEAHKRLGYHDQVIEDCNALGYDYKFYLPGDEIEKSAKQILDESYANKSQSKKKVWKFEEDDN